MTAPLYNSEILRLAASVPHKARLASPQASASRTSPICGSRVTADVVLDADGRIAEFAQEVRACALGQASAAILAGAVIGHKAESLRAAEAALRDWLKNDAPLPDLLAARFPQLALFAPARAHPARHASICLPFDAAASAVELAGQAALTG